MDGLHLVTNAPINSLADSSLNKRLELIYKVPALTIDGCSRFDKCLKSLLVLSFSELEVILLDLQTNSDVFN